MAISNLINGVKQRVKTIYNNFFYDGEEAPAPQMQQEYADSYAQEGQQGAAQAYPQSSAAPSAGYGNPPYQQSYPNPYQQAPAQQQPQGHRVRRAERNQQDKVVDFNAYQQQTQQPYAAGQQPAPQMPQQAYQMPQNHPQFAPQQTLDGHAAGSQTRCARIINARGMGDCRSAITLLRKGDSVLIVLENVADPAEMRRLVDTLSGACYSLTATITKVSRYGVYLLAPQPVAVFADQATNMMNSVPGRQPRNYPANAAQQRMNYPPQSGYQQQAAYQQPYQQQPAQNPYQQPYQPPMQQPSYQNPQPSQSFTQRSAMPEEAPQDFYQRPAPKAMQSAAFSAQPAGYGYAPDESRAADQ